MKKHQTLLVSALIAGLAIMLASCAGIKSTPYGYSSHAEYIKAGQQITCSECHDDQQKGTMKSYGSFNHTPVFVKNHGLYASQDDRLCVACHKVSFCNDCHATRSEMKPALKNGNRSDLDLPHRGNYMTMHKIEGKVDPASCYRCHGRGNNERCFACHR